MSKIKQAVVLAAGRGTRMGGLTADLPKPMLPVHGRPILEHVFDGLASVGVERFFVVVGYLHEVVEAHFRDWRLPVEFRLQETVDGTGSATRLAREFVGADPFLLTFGDILCGPAAYTRCARMLLDNPATKAVLGVKDVDDPWRGAAVYVNGEGVIHRIIEKPPIGTSTTRWNSAGLYSMDPVVFPYLDRLTPSARGEYELTSIFDLMMADGLELRISPIIEEWRDIGYPADLEAVRGRQG
ncbi:MAG: nucleotidyltransferase family protein [Acidobacteria bacterium]|mgnify:CR=1 FL=1|nr:nucleotidyltransferase family protein [Acidobacteriota bacterium]